MTLDWSRKGPLLIGIAFLALAGSFAAGRYTASPPPSHDERKVTASAQSSASSAKVAHISGEGPGGVKFRC